jgi:hypothetical protein
MDLFPFRGRLGRARLVGINNFERGFDGLSGSARIRRLAFRNSVERLSPLKRRTAENSFNAEDAEERGDAED